MGIETGTDRWWSNPAHTDFGPTPRRSDLRHIAVAQCESAPARNRRKCASHGRRWRRPKWSAPRGRGIPCGTISRASPEGKPRYREGFRDKSTERTPSQDTDHGRRSLSHEHHRDSAQHTSETRRRADGPSVERRQFGRDSPLIVGEAPRSERRVLGAHITPKKFKSKKPNSAAGFRFHVGYSAGKNVSRTAVTRYHRVHDIVPSLL